MKGSEQLVYHKIEKHKRIAFPFASIILILFYSITILFSTVPSS